MSKKYKFQPNYAVHPGETLREKLEELNMSPKEFAIRVAKPIKTISNVLNGKSSITPEMAVQFEKVLKIPANFWMTKQANYSEFIAREKEKENIAKSIEWSKKFSYSILAKMGYVKPTRLTLERADELLSFFNISKPESWEDIYINQKSPIFFRISLKHAKNPYMLSALLRIGEIGASKIDTPPYNKKELKRTLYLLKVLMFSEDPKFLIKIQHFCKHAGVKVIYTPSLPETLVNGVVRWINNNPVIQMTDRFKRYDIFWFTLFHELGHILLHGNKKSIFLEEVKNIDESDIKEQEADKFAADFLLSEEEYKIIINAITSKSRTPKQILQLIEDFAWEFRTHMDIIIGRILYENKGLYKYGFLQKKLKRIDFIK